MNYKNIFNPFSSGLEDDDFDTVQKVRKYIVIKRGFRLTVQIPHHLS